MQGWTAGCAQSVAMEQQQVTRNRLELGPPPPELAALAAQDLRETEHTRGAALRQLRNSILADECLDCNVDDEYLLRFLRPTKFYPESALTLVRGYFAHIRKHADAYATIGPLQQRVVFENSLVSVSPVRDQMGRRVTIIRFGAWSSQVCTMDELYSAVVTCAELGAKEPTTQIAGSVALLDMKGICLRHVASLSPAYAKKTVDWLQGSFPMRFKAFHIVNQPRIFDLVFAIFKPFLSKKLKARIHFHGSDMSSLHHHVSPTCLTSEHDGLLEEYDQAGLMEVLAENEHIFKEIRTYAYQHQK